MTAPLDLDTIHLDHGAHDDPDEGHCLMEVVSMFAKEPFTDHPRCVSPYLRGFGIGLNDRATDERRQDLRRFIPLVVGTAGDGLDEQRRWLAADHITRVVAPKWLDRAGLTEHATTLRGLPPITDRVSYNAAYPVVRAARDAAWKVRGERLEPVREAVRRAVRENRHTTIRTQLPSVPAPGQPQPTPRSSERRPESADGVEQVAQWRDAHGVRRIPERPGRRVAPAAGTPSRRRKSA